SLEKNEEKSKNLDEIMKELDSLIGLDKVKKLVKEIKAFVEIQKKREEEKLKTEPIVLHMVFGGNPGTGKTTVARILGKLLKEMGVLQKGHLVEVERADLVGEYIGHTAQKTREQIKKALGGILFIDEAYSLARGGEKDFGKEAIDTLVKAMEDHKNNLILILAGYKNEMEFFLRTNPGLRSRFPIHIEFSDYNIEELLLIAQLMVKKREYKLSRGALKKLREILEKNNFRNQDKLGNARLVRNIIEKAIRLQAVRLVSKKRVTREELILLEEGDIPEVYDD
ncbi:MAG: stage sporulation protein, partial [Thermosediminibacterales bacterium]|nr:stage sporulation protein [Thermosediminibacterales bacterium]